VKHLHLLRHAKSSGKGDPTLEDHDRPLAGRGRRACERVAEHMRREGIRPTLVLCSSARRARETLDGIRPALADDVATQVERALYTGDEARLLARLRRVPAGVSEIMLVGHNPALQRLAEDLAGSGDDLARLREKFPTAALATLAIPDVEWDQLEAGAARLVAYVVPRELG
jgi:phosphohistidine phosphatase